MSHAFTANADELLRLFFTPDTAACQLTAVTEQELPADYRRLLVHEQHMTVTVESFHKSQVDVQVLDVHSTAEHYARKILLRRQTDQQVVQFGIVRLHRHLIPATALAEIESQRTPLGRVLIEQDVMRQVKLVGVWRVKPGPELERLFNSSSTTFGRSAMIHVNHEPVIELLEIVAPLPTGLNAD